MDNTTAKYVQQLISLNFSSVNETQKIIKERFIVSKENRTWSKTEVI